MDGEDLRSLDRRVTILELSNSNLSNKVERIIAISEDVAVVKSLVQHIEATRLDQRKLVLQIVGFSLGGISFIITTAIALITMF